MDRFAKSCKEFRLTISNQKTNVMAQGADPPDITINGNHLDIVDQLTYLGSNITNDLSLDAEISKRIGKASTTMHRLAQRVWENKMLTTNTKMSVCRACKISTINASEAWTMYASQEKRLSQVSAFHMRCLRRILKIS